MRVKMLSTYAGPAGSCAPGKTIDLPDDQAKGLIDGGYAEAVGGEVAEKPKRGRPAGSRTKKAEDPPPPPLDHGGPSGA